MNKGIEKKPKPEEDKVQDKVLQDSILELKTNKVFMQKVEDLQKSLAKSLQQKESSFVLC